MGVMNTESIVSVILAAAVALKEPATVVTSQAMKDLYEAAKYYLRRKFAALPAAAEALEFATAKPQSPARKAALVEEAEPADLPRDGELTSLVSRLEELLPRSVPPSVTASVTGTRNQVNVAGGDLTVTSRLVQRNVITPDERHLAREQRTRLRTLIHDLAARLGNKGGEPNPAAAHAMLQRCFDVSSYLLIPRERYPEALAYLRQQLVIRRSALFRRHPGQFRQEMCRSIYARATELGWSRETLFRFASKRADVGRPLTSLRQLDASQLRSLADRIHRVPANADAS